MVRRKTGKIISCESQSARAPGYGGVRPRAETIVRAVYPPGGTRP